MSQEEKFLYNIANLNPEPVGIFTLPNHKHLKYKKSIGKIIKEVPPELIQKFDAEKLTYHICNKYDQNIFKQFQILSELKKDLKSILLTYIKKIGYLCDEMIIHDAWINNSSKKSTLNFHYHTNSFLSGNYFINFDNKNHTPLTFINDRLSNVNCPSISVPLNTNDPTIYNQKIISMPVKEGQILIWRSQLSHGYMKPNNQDERITLSFNSMPKKCMNSTGKYAFEVVE
tara:strand:+ start:204 stop:890 length:687 start_codon:yes stop_codon:yes gene_type:complete